MSTNDQDIRALVYLAGRIRDDTQGCGKWDAEGTFVVFARELKGKHLATAAEAVIRHAADPAAKTPGAIMRGFLPAASEAPVRKHPPKRNEECPTHPGWYRDHCGGCNADRLAADHDESETPMPNPSNLTGAAMVRAALSERGASA